MYVEGVISVTVFTDHAWTPVVHHQPAWAGDTVTGYQGHIHQREVINRYSTQYQLLLASWSARTTRFNCSAEVDSKLTDDSLQGLQFKLQSLDLRVDLK